jgi:hypothetical protein
MARIDRRYAGCEQRYECGLWPSEMKRYLIASLGRDLSQVVIPSSAWIKAKTWAGLAK